MKDKKRILVLGLIILVAAFFRLYRLGEVPPSPSLDEVSIGWNAYSIAETSRDEYGYQWPVLLRAYDDWRPALYVYLAIPFVETLGLSAVTVRLPAALLGILAVWLTYLLVKEIFSKSKISNQLSVVSYFLMAISPWHIYLSRLGHEVGAGLTFSILVVWLFLRFINQKKATFLYLSALIFSLSFYTYQSQKIFAPLLVLVLFLVYRQTLLKLKKQILIAGVLGLVVMAPLLKATLAPGGLSRAQGASIFANLPKSDKLAQDRVFRDRLGKRFVGVIFDNPRLANGLYISRAYLSHFDPVWLFYNEIKESHKVPSLGLFYLWQLPLFLVGGHQLIKRRLDKRAKALVFGWLFLGPLPAALATQTPHGMRSFNMLPMPFLISAVGLNFLASRIKIPKKLLLTGLGVTLLFSLGYFHHNYFYNFPFEQAKSFQTPLAQAMEYVLQIDDEYDKIVFSERGQADQSYMFFLFFSQTDPVWYQAQGGTTSGGFGDDHAFGKYEFRGIDWNQEMQKISQEKTLYVGNVLSALPDIPEGVAGLKTFKLPDGTEAIKVVPR